MKKDAETLAKEVLIKIIKNLNAEPRGFNSPRIVDFAGARDEAKYCKHGLLHGTCNACKKSGA